jgi:hypothetical protein
MSALWVWFRLDEGWYPHDDGAFAHAAVRVLNGELPHRDFTEMYTGAMTFLNAGVFLALGEDLFFLRLPVFLLFLAFVPCVYYISRQFVGPIPAVLATLLAVTWGYAVYPIPMASWYVLFLTTYGAAALVRWTQTDNRRWLFVAGVLGGLAIAVKITGVYYVAAVVLFLACRSPREHEGDVPEATRGRVSASWLVGSVAGVTFAWFVVASVFGSHIGLLEAVNLIAPIAAVSAVVLAWPKVSGSEPPRIVLQARRVAVFAAGLVLPLAALSVPYIVSGALGDLINGVIVSPQSRRDVVYRPTPDLVALLPTILVVAILLFRHRLEPRPRRLLDVAAVGLAATVLVAAAFSPAGYVLYLATGRGIATVVVLVGAVALVGRREDHDAKRELFVLVLGLIALTGLVQFPHAGPVYYFYVAPFAAIGVVALLGRRPHAVGILPAVLTLAFVAFGAAFLDRSSLLDLGSRAPTPAGEVLGAKASVRVLPSEKKRVDEVVSLLRAHTNGRYVFAGPDLPHLYFLSQLENPTRSLFDFLDRRQSARGRLLLDTLVARDVTAVAINIEPEGSRPLEPKTLAALERMYPKHRVVGGIDVRWAE